MNGQVGVVHEAEVQRQYVRLRVPASVVINGVRSEVYDWSVSGLAVHIRKDAPAVGTRLSGEFWFDFGEFQTSIQFSAEVRHATTLEYAGETIIRIGLQFVDMSPRKQDLLRYVTSAFLTGELVSSGDLLNVVQRDNSASPRKVSGKAPEAETRLGRLAELVRAPLTWLILASIVLFSLSLTANAFYRTSFVSELTTAEVMTDTPTARAPVAGTITFIAGEAGQTIMTGQPLLGIRRATGEEIFVDSACDCEILAVSRLEREFVEAGEVVVRMIHPESRTFIRLYVSKANAPWIFDNEPDSIEGRVLGAPERYALSIQNSYFDESRDMVVIDLMPIDSMPSDLAGRPAVVTLEAGRTSIVGRVRAWFRG